MNQGKDLSRCFPSVWVLRSAWSRAEREDYVLDSWRDKHFTSTLPSYLLTYIPLHLFIHCHMLFISLVLSSSSYFFLFITFYCWLLSYFTSSLSHFLSLSYVPLFNFLFCFVCIISLLYTFLVPCPLSFLLFLTNIFPPYLPSISSIPTFQHFVLCALSESSFCE